MSSKTLARTKHWPLSHHRVKLAARRMLLLSSAQAMVAQGVEHVEFNPAFFPGGASGMQIDISRFNQGNVILPGSYRSDIYLNDQWIGRETLTFAAVEGKQSAQLCLEHETLLSFGIDLDAVKEHTVGTAKAVAPMVPLCGDIASYIPGANARFDSGESQLRLEVPQLYLARQARGYVSPEQWDSGVNAAFVRYNANTFGTQAGGRSLTSSYLGVNSGFNLGDWHFRHNGSYSHSATSSGYQSSATYVQRELTALRSQLMVGEIYTLASFSTASACGAQASPAMTACSRTPRTALHRWYVVSPKPMPGSACVSAASCWRSFPWRPARSCSMTCLPRASAAT